MAKYKYILQYNSNFHNNNNNNGYDNNNNNTSIIWRAYIIWYILYN